MYTIDTLSLENSSQMTQQDVDRVNSLVRMIQDSMDMDSPKPGDVVRYTDPSGNYFPCARICCATGGNISIGVYASCFVTQSGVTVTNGTYEAAMSSLSFVGREKASFTTSTNEDISGVKRIDFQNVLVNVWECNLTSSPS